MNTWKPADGEIYYHRFANTIRKATWYGGHFQEWQWRNLTFYKTETEAIHGTQRNWRKEVRHL